MNRLILFISLLLISTQAMACPVCGFGQDGSQESFILATLIMTGMPLIFVGGVVYFLRKRYLALQAEDQEPEV